MSQYRKEMRELVQELRMGKFRHLTRQRRLRQAEVLDFIIEHPEGLAELFAQQEQNEQ